MTSTDQTPGTPEDVLAEALAKASEIRAAEIAAAETEFDRTEAELSKTYETSVEAAGEAYTVAKMRAENAYGEARKVAITAYNLSTGHDQQAGG